MRPLAAVVAVAVAGAALVAAPAANGADWEPPAFERSISGTGLAPLYAWGVQHNPVTDEVLVGDYFNYKVRRFDTDGNLLGSFGRPASERQGQPYSLAVDPRDGSPLPTWDQALDRLDADPEAQPAHVVRFGRQLDIQGIIATEGDADRRVAYLTKYLAKAISDTYGGDDVTAAQLRHMEKLHDQARLLPCSPRCWNWLRYGVQPQAAAEGMTPGQCPGKAHAFEPLGEHPRRVMAARPVVLLVSDGWDRGDPERLRQEMDRLRRSASRLMWLNPLLGSPDYLPLTRGMRAALPYVDDFLPVHNLVSLEALAQRLSTLPQRRARRFSSSASTTS